MSNKNEVPIICGEISRLTHADDFFLAASRLVVGRFAYIIPETLNTNSASIVDREAEIALLLRRLHYRNLHDPGLWVANEVAEDVRSVFDSGIGGVTHHSWQENQTVLRWLYNRGGSFEVITARAMRVYISSENNRLNELLQGNMTDPTFADPQSFRLGTVGPNESLIFRLAAEGAPLLHDLHTTSPERMTEQYDIRYLRNDEVIAR